MKAIFQIYFFVFFSWKIHANMGGCLFWEGIYFMSWMSLTDISVCHLRKCWNHKELDKSFIQYFHIIHMDTSYCLTQHLSSFEGQNVLWLLINLKCVAVIKNSLGWFKKRTWLMIFAGLLLEDLCSLLCIMSCRIGKKIFMSRLMLVILMLAVVFMLLSFGNDFG